jgi:SAM-dependent methyltransferase
MKNYTHDVKTHNLLAPNEIVPVIINLIEPKSIVDIGCGLGTFLRVFKERGINDILGVDGPWCNKSLLFQNIDPSEFREQNFENKLKIDKKYDLAICLEVAEHLTKKRAVTFIEELTSCSDVVLFSAAVPMQGGDHHYNEQWLSYWKLLFEKYDFEICDCLRPIFWNNENVFWWYRQNMVLFTRTDYDKRRLQDVVENQILNIIHPEFYKVMIDYKEKNGWKRHSKRLLKSILFKINPFRFES